MKRRPILASIAALTTGSGCIGSAMNQSSPNQMNKSVSVSNVNERKSPSGLKFDVDVVEAEITNSTTARVRFTYSNTGEKTLKLNIDTEMPSPQHSVSGPSDLILLSDAYDPTRASNDCWKPENDSFPHWAVGHQHPIEPEDNETLEYEVWAAPQQETKCIRSGEYRFKVLYGSFTLTVDRDGTET